MQINDTFFPVNNIKGTRVRNQISSYIPKVQYKVINIVDDLIYLEAPDKEIYTIIIKNHKPINEYQKIPGHHSY